MDVTVNDADLLRVRSGKPGGVPRVVGLPVGEKGAHWNARAAMLARLADEFVARARDAATNEALTRAERADRIGTMAAPFYAKLNTAGLELAAGAKAIAERARSATFTSPYAKVAGHMPFFDLAVVQALNALPATQRASRLATLAAEPWTDLDLLDALARVPRIVSRLSPEEADTLRVAAFRALRPDEAAAMDTEAAQFALARSAIRAAVEAVGEVVGSLQDLAVAAPGVMASLE